MRTITLARSTSTGRTFWSVDVDAVVSSIVDPERSCEPGRRPTSMAGGDGSLLASEIRSGLRSTTNIYAGFVQKMMSPPVAPPHA